MHLWDRVNYILTRVRYINQSKVLSNPEYKLVNVLYPIYYSVILVMFINVLNVLASSRFTDEGKFYKK